ncbi:MAG TPA: 50S ribosomal protein L25 [Verrucomicrobiales bacterium]|nr:50S ribosomal protein L25 [Pedosphaera sp.]HAO65972.1 50S ribosomal protein L25 [Verrucomicrobiales bacterium]HBP55515.1 50S ribosomal protein L25 [Verrucomicrobiales bacterium]HCP38079.1 50S ribosomal protein L25 [Verrucomicrobiales bacterium]HCZ04393.1 50S ribosomal protein L25 [Verrucomicrobiales bacterium]|tara:strand:+ start:16363 stop:16983 length:621 start_codon:yes stop_codon:yes gene_type:complete
MEAVALNAQSRSELRRTRVKKIRASGLLPGVLYGCQKDPKPLTVCAKDFERMVKHSASENLLVKLAVEGDGGHLALVQEVQRHPLSGLPLHVDFRAVVEDQPVILSIPIEPRGEAHGVKNEGGNLEHVLFSVKIKALPKDLPEVILVDVTELRSGQTLHLGELPLPENVEVIGETGIPAFSVSIGRTARSEASKESAAEGEEDAKK